MTTSALPRLLDRVQSMVYLDAFVPERGKALVDYVPHPIEPGTGMPPITLEEFDGRPTTGRIFDENFVEGGSSARAIQHAMLARLPSDRLFPERDWRKP